MDDVTMLALERSDKPAVLLARQFEISAEVDERGNLILRQVGQFDDDGGLIVVAAANVETFVSILSEVALTRARRPADVPTARRRRSPDPSNAERQRSFKQRRRAVTGESNGTEASVTDGVTAVGLNVN